MKEPQRRRGLQKGTNPSNHYCIEFSLVEQELHTDVYHNAFRLKSPEDFKEALHEVMAEQGPFKDEKKLYKTLLPSLLIGQCFNHASQRDKAGAAEILGQLYN